jgi:alpha-glucosidase
VTARKADGVWYVGGMTDWSPRTVEVDFSFLGEGEHTAQILSDVKGGKATDYQITSVEVDAQTKLTVELNAGGGFVMIVK